ncbi:hypothetical protein [Cellulomonas marina]|uniref:Uncharacterized protein n=1 Tax=Cellulomonas marina TaxID=988821 RepID=A0A1I0YCC8_9CELL|nr:hypothetical protein [Cellulomonas marina]GIG29652.1 hypothetical protein Cma02nite_22520 [Cellulomonas marina]SFB10842.1 hypothetical protein SAMN05421867_10745 [Cellulomonas marina]
MSGEDLVARLLAGPRGRRLAFEAAATAPGGEDLRLAALAPATALDDGSTVTLVAVRGASGGGVPSLDDLRPAGLPPGPAGVVAALARVEVEALASGPDPRPTLAAVVDTARSWQPPEGLDRLLAQPAVRDALAPALAAVLAHPAAASWDAPVQRGAQRLVQHGWADEPPPQPSLRDRADPREVVARWCADLRAAESAAAGRPPAPVSGAWWCRPTAADGALATAGDGPDGVPWALDLVEDHPGDEALHVGAAVVDPEARVVEVRSAAGWAALTAAHPLEVTSSRGYLWSMATGGLPGEAGAGRSRADDRWVVPDVDALADGADGVHLTVLAWLETSGRALPVPGRPGTRTFLGGWDPDATLWLRAALVEQGAPRTWRRDDRDPGRGWRPDGDG